MSIEGYNGEENYYPPQSAQQATGEQQGGGQLPATLTLQPCNCGHETCQRTGFREGMFYQGSGFDRPLAEEVKRRYDAGSQPRGLARLDAQGLAELRALILRVIDDGDVKGKSRTWELYEMNYGDGRICSEARANAQRLDFCDAIQQAIVQRAAPAIKSGIFEQSPLHNGSVCKNCGESKGRHRGERQQWCPAEATTAKGERQ